MGNSMKKTDMVAFEQLYQNKMKQRLRKKFKTQQGGVAPCPIHDIDEDLCFSTCPGESNSQNTMYMVKVSKRAHIFDFSTQYDKSIKYQTFDHCVENDRNLEIRIFST
jgi:hypothetical protein